MGSSRSVRNTGSVRITGSGKTGSGKTGNAAREPQPALDVTAPAAYRAGRNWIGGSWLEAERGGYFEVACAAEPDGAVTTRRFPRSGAADVREAIAAAEGAGPALRALGAGRRREALNEALERLARDRCDALGARLGLEPDEWAVHWPERIPLPEAGPVDGPIDGPIDGPASDSCKPVLWLPHWSELVRGTARSLLDLVEEGRPLVWIADPQTPELALAFARALEACGDGGLPAGAINLLFDDGDTALRAAVCDAQVTRLVAKAHERRLDQLRELVAKSPRRSNAFGAGVFDAADMERNPETGADLHLTPVLNASHRVLENADPERAAARVLRTAWGRTETLSGQLPGQVARVLCHERRFSEFTEALLDLLEEERTAHGARPALAAIEPDLARHIAWVLQLGHDEGATLIHDPRSPVGGDEGANPRRSRPRRGSGLAPTLFTNVEETMRLAHLRRPAPVLLLMRVQSDEAGEALQKRLEGGVGTRGAPRAS